MNKKIAFFLLLLLLAGLLSGCWSRKEITEISIVLGTGVDWTSDGRIRLTVQIARPGAFLAGGEAGGGKEPSSWVISAEGKTVEEAVRYLNMKAPREIYWGHCIILVFGEEMAKKGMRLATNFFQRDRQPREFMWVMVAKGEAKDFLETYSVLEKTSSQAAGFLNRMKTGYSVQLRNFTEMLASKGVQPAVTAVEVTEAGITPQPGQDKKPSPGKQVELAGVAVFKEDRLIGWLDTYETRGLLWLKGETIKGVVTVPSPEEPDKDVSIKIRWGKTRVTPEYDGRRLQFNVLVRVEGDMMEQQSSEDLVKPEKIKILENEMAAEIKKRAAVTLEKAQQEYGVDIFGFGDAFHRKYKEEWRKLKDRWDEEFTQADVDITVEPLIRETGLLTRRASMPEE